MANNGNMPDFISINEAEDESGLFVPVDHNRSSFSSNGVSTMNGHPRTDDSYVTDDLSRMIAQASRQGGWKEPTARPIATPSSNQHQQFSQPFRNGLNGAQGVKAQASESNPATQVSTPTQANSQAQQTQSNGPAIPTIKPNFIIFGAAEDDLSYIIPKKSLQNLPDVVLQKLSMKGNTMGPSIYMTNYEQLEPMIRLKDYLEHRQYRPFNPQIPLEYTSEDGKTQVWQAPKRAVEALQTLRVTPATEDLFYKEIELYLFAIELSYDELRRLTLNHIINRYPKSIETIWRMIRQLYSTIHPEDRILRQHIVDLITVNREELTSHESFSEYMKGFVKIEGALGQTLFDAYTKVLADMKRRLGSGTALRKVSTPSIKPESVEQKPLTPTPVKRSESVACFDSPKHKADEGWPSQHIRPSDLPKIADAFLSQRLVVAKKSGYGTLVRPDAPRTRNRDFQFSAGELLLVKSSEVESSRNAHNIVIYNSEGQKGDVLAELIADFPDDLGVRLRAGAIEWGQLYQIPRPQPASSSNGFPDREERLNKSERRRSMSPRARLLRY